MEDLRTLQAAARAIAAEDAAHSRLAEIIADLCAMRGRKPPGGSVVRAAASRPPVKIPMTRLHLPSPSRRPLPTTQSTPRL